MRTLFQILITIIFILALNEIAAGQVSGYVYLVSDSARLVTGSHILVSRDYQNIVLEPIPGKVTRWEIKRVEETQVLDSVVTVIDNTEDLSIYRGTWVAAVNNNLAFLNKTFHYSFTVGSYIELKFTGRRIEWWGERNLSHGRAEVSIDGVVDRIVAPSGEGPDIVRNKPSYVKTWPVSGEHTIKIKVLDTKSVLHDFFRTVR